MNRTVNQIGFACLLLLAVAAQPTWHSAKEIPQTALDSNEMRCTYGGLCYSETVNVCGMYYVKCNGSCSVQVSGQLYCNVNQQLRRYDESWTEVDSTTTGGYDFMGGSLVHCAAYYDCNDDPCNEVEGELECPAGNFASFHFDSTHTSDVAIQPGCGPYAG